MVGTRGVPARYGGFETAIEEVGRRLAQRGHEVTVYCRRPADGEGAAAEHLGMRCVNLPALRTKALETLSHTALSSAHSLFRGPYDVAMLFNSANAPFTPLLRRRGARVAIHVDGLEWQRAKWSGAGRRYYRAAEALSVRWADALIADSGGISEYYLEEFGAGTELLSYGAPILEDLGDDRLAGLGLRPLAYHLVVARFEPENHLHVIVDGYRRSGASHPLVVVGSAPYSDAYTEHVRNCAAGDPRIRFTGSIWDQEQLDQLYAHALTYLHGHSVGGTNPSLLRAMGAGAAAVAWDVRFNREVIGEDGRFFAAPADVARQVEDAESDPVASERYGASLRDRAALAYRWDDVADGYEDLAQRLAKGVSRRGEVTGRRRHAGNWQVPEVEYRSATESPAARP